MAFSMVMLKSSRSIGFVAKSNAPLFMAVRIFPISPYADTMIHFRAGFLNSLILVSNVNPSISGILISLSIMLMSGCSSNTLSASMPLCAKKNSYSPLRIFLLKYCVNSISRSNSSSTLKIFTAIIYIFKFIRQI